MSRDSQPGSWYVAVEGAIGVGKTTLARMMRDHLDTALLLEVFEENPFLMKFYESRARYAFQTQMFFLLSRYRQQQQLPHLLEQNAIISDYMFAKDRLFAALNLVGDEWEIYKQLHDALALQIPTPDLVVYLQADTDVLMARIAQRDRHYERDMDREYIDALRQAYERFFEGYHDTPVLPVDTNNLNFVGDPADFQAIAGQIRSALKEGSYQQRLPQFQGLAGVQAPPARAGTLAEYQRFHVELDRTKGFITDPYFNYLRLSEEMGELGSELAHLWREEDRLVRLGQDQAQTRQSILAARRQNLESELADCMAYLLKLANYAGIDLEKAYVDKMHINETRTWTD